MRIADLDGKKIKLQIWDTARQERFRTITTAYYRGAMGIMLIYDVTDERSFNNIRNWIRNIDQYASEGVDKILIGNKCDDLERRVVESERGAELAREYGLKFIETSAKNNINVEEAFYTLSRDIKKRLIDTGKLDEHSGAISGSGIRVDLKKNSETDQNENGNKKKEKDSFSKLFKSNCC